MLDRVKQIVNNTGMGTDALEFHTMLARWESSIEFDEDINEYVLQRAREIAVGKDKNTSRNFIQQNCRRRALNIWR